MKLYLSSNKLGNEISKLKKLISKTNKKVAYIPNALDYSNDSERRKNSEQTDIESLKELNLEVELVDLRNYFDKEEELKKTLDKKGIIFIRGGNVFVLRQAMKLSGFDNYIKKLNKKEDFLYIGYSAGTCILAPNLRGIDLMDDITQKPYGKNLEVIWKGLGVIDYLIVPHYKSDHHESEGADKSVEYLKKHNLPFKTLKDGEVIIIE